jgi:hypothetical protein
MHKFADELKYASDQGVAGKLISAIPGKHWQNIAGSSHVMIVYKCVTIYIHPLSSTGNSVLVQVTWPDDTDETIGQFSTTFSNRPMHLKPLPLSRESEAGESYMPACNHGSAIDSGWVSAFNKHSKDRCGQPAKYRLGRWMNERALYACETHASYFIGKRAESVSNEAIASELVPLDTSELE